MNNRKVAIIISAIVLGGSVLVLGGFFCAGLAVGILRAAHR